jgi:hypothetical protein
VDGPASRRKFVFGIVSLGASRWPPQIVIRYPPMGAVDLRNNVLQLLRLIASPEQQLAYERDNPIVDTKVELICMWFDDLYKPSWSLFQDAFSSAEQEQLSVFDQFYQAHKKQVPDTLAAMHKSPVWQEIMAAACNTLQCLGGPAGG